MKSSWRICQIAGIAIRIHATFPLLLIWIGLARYLERKQWVDVIAGIVLVSALFVFVTLHELGHALAARRVGIRTRDITLLPIGGVARLEKMPRQSWDELFVSIAGPGVNIVLAFLFFVLLAVRGIPAELETEVLEKSFLAQLAWANVGLALFNLIPAFPMDGGRVLRAILGMRMNFVRATKIAAMIGQGIAVMLGVVGLIANPALALVAVFIWFGAAEESRATQLQQTFAGTPVAEVMMTEFHVLAPDDPLQRAVDFALAGRQQHFPVLDHEKIVGVLGWDDLLTGLSRSGALGRVEEYMRHRVGAARITDSVDRVLSRAGENANRAIPVVEGGKVVGLFTAENAAESVLLREAMNREARHLVAACSRRSAK